MNVLRSLFVIVFLSITVLLSGCGTAPVKVDLKPSANLNPDINNQPLPVVVRLYQLSKSKNFIQATFWELWNNDKKTLGNTMLSKNVVTVVPNVPQKASIKRNKQANFIGVVAIFRKPVGNDWRVIQQLNKPQSMSSDHINILLHGNKVKVET